MIDSTPFPSSSAAGVPPLTEASRARTALTRRAPEPMYRQLADRLLAQIGRGELAPGAQLESESALMARYSVSRVTVRQATALLREQGTLVARRGKGTFVVERIVRHDLDELRGFYDAVRSQGIDPQLQLLEFTNDVLANDPLAPGGLPVRLKRLYSVEGRPFALVVGYLPAAAAALGRECAERLTVYQIVQQYLSIRIARADVTIRCQKSPRDVRAQLGLKAGDSSLVMERRSHAHDGSVCEFMRVHIVPERCEFRLSVPGTLEIASSIHRVAPADARPTT